MPAKKTMVYSLIMASSLIEKDNELSHILAIRRNRRDRGNGGKRGAFPVQGDRL